MMGIWCVCAGFLEAYGMLSRDEELTGALADSGHCIWYGEREQVQGYPCLRRTGD